jgi:hypothetical protein
MGFRELSSVVLLLGEWSLLAYDFCYPLISGSLGSHLNGVLVSLAFQDEDRRSCVVGAWRSEFLCVLGSRTYH